MVTAPIEILNNAIVTLVLGLILSCFFDALLYLTEEITGKKRNCFVAINDFFIIVAYSIVLILILYYCNNGAYRGIYLLSLILSLYVYHIVFSKIFRKITWIILKPIIYVLKTIINFIRKIYAFLKHSIEKILLRLYNNKKRCNI